MISWTAEAFLQISFQNFPPRIFFLICCQFCSITMAPFSRCDRTHSLHLNPPSIWKNLKTFRATRKSSDERISCLTCLMHWRIVEKLVWRGGNQTAKQIMLFRPIMHDDWYWYKLSHTVAQIGRLKTATNLNSNLFLVKRLRACTRRCWQPVVNVKSYSFHVSQGYDDLQRGKWIQLIFLRFFSQKVFSNKICLSLAKWVDWLVKPGEEAI